MHVPLVYLFFSFWTKQTYLKASQVWENNSNMFYMKNTIRCIEVGQKKKRLNAIELKSYKC